MPQWLRVFSAKSDDFLAQEIQLREWSQNSLIERGRPGALYDFIHFEALWLTVCKQVLL